MIQSLKYLLTQLKESSEYLQSYRKQAFSQFDSQIVSNILSKLIPQINIKNLKQFLLSNHEIYSNYQISLFLKEYFFATSISISKVIAFIFKDLNKLFLRTSKYDEIKIEYCLVQLFSKFIKQSIQTNKLKREFKFNYPIDKLYTILKNRTYQIKQQNNVSIVETQLNQLSKQQNFYLFFEESIPQNSKIEQIKQIGNNIKIEAKAMKVAQYFRMLINELKQLQSQKQLLIQNTYVSYQNIFLLFSNSLDKQVSILSSTLKFQQYSNLKIKESLTTILKKHSINLQLSLKVIKAIILPRSETYREILQKRQLVELNSRQIKQSLRFMQNIFKCQKRIQQNKVEVLFLRQIFQQIDINTSGSISPQNILTFINKYSNNSINKLKYKQLMLIMYRFTNNYQSQQINYVQFIAELTN